MGNCFSRSTSSYSVRCDQSPTVYFKTAPQPTPTGDRIDRFISNLRFTDFMSARLLQYYSDHPCPPDDTDVCPTCAAHESPKSCAICGCVIPTGGLCNEVCEHVCCFRCTWQYLEEWRYHTYLGALCPAKGCGKWFRTIYFLKN